MKWSTFYVGVTTFLMRKTIVEKRTLRLRFFISACAFAFLFCSFSFLGNPAIAQVVKDWRKEWKLREHVKELKEKVKEAEKAGKADEVEKIKKDLELIRDSLKDKELRDPNISDEDASKLFHDISDFLGIDPYLELMPPGSMQLPPLKPDPDAPWPPEEEAETKGKPEEIEPPLFDYDQPPFQEVIASVQVREEEKEKPAEGLSVGTADALIDTELLAMELTGTGTTTSLVFNLTNKTDGHLCVIIPTGTLVTTTSKGYQPYQTGRIPPIVLEPGETLVKEFPAYCTDNSLEPAPTGASVKYALQTGPLNEQCQKLAELIAVTQGMRDLYENCGDEAEPDDISLEPYWEKRFYQSWMGAEAVEATGLDWRKRFYQSWMGAEAPQKAPQYGPDELLELLRRIEKEGWYALIPKASEPEDWGKRLAPSWMGAEAVKPFSIGSFELQSPLSLPGTLQFGLKEGTPELRLALSYTEKGEEQTGSLVATKPRGSVEVSVETTDDPEIVRFNINKIRAYSPSVTFDDRDRGDIMLTLNSPEKSTGILNIKTGEVIGAASLKALGEKYKEPFPAAVSYRGKLNFATRELNLEVSGTSFEPVKLKERGLYQRTQSEKFWDSVQLYTIWDETNDVGQKELRKVMTEQLKTEFPEGRAEELAGMVTKEIMDKVDEVKDLHKGLKEEKFDFSKLDPTLKWRKT